MNNIRAFKVSDTQEIVTLFRDAVHAINSKHYSSCSITAKKPAERMGFVVIKEQTVVRNGVSLINYAMEKKLS